VGDVTYKSQMLGGVLIEPSFLPASADSSCGAPLSISLDHSMYPSWVNADPAKRLRIVHEIVSPCIVIGGLGRPETFRLWLSYQFPEVALAIAGLTRPFHSGAFPRRTVHSIKMIAN